MHQLYKYFFVITPLQICNHSNRGELYKKKWLAVKIDLVKVFDKFKWNFIHETLLDAGIPESLNALIMNIISTASTQIFWNGQV